jgi:hypothetical protein
MESTAMSTPQDHPVRRFAEAWLHAYEAFLEACRMYRECAEEAEHISEQGSAEAERSSALLRRHRKLLERWAAILHYEFSRLDPLLERAWKEQVRDWVEGLDEELSRLKRGSD